MAVPVTIHVRDTSFDPIEAVLVQIYDELGTTFVTQATTGPSGDVTFILPGTPDPGTTYQLCFFKAGVIFDPATYLIQVLEPVVAPQTNVFDVVGVIATLPQPVNPDYCRISGVLTDVSGVGIAGRSIRILPGQSYTDPQANLGHHFTSDPTIINGNIAIAPTTVRTDSKGYVDFELPRGGMYYLHISGAANPITIVEPFLVPDISACRLHDLLFPYIASVTYTPSSVSINRAFGVYEATVDLTVLDQIARPYEQSKILEYLDFSSNDENVVTTKYVPDSTQLTLIAVDAGSAIVSASRKIDVTAPRVPNVPDLTDPGLSVLVI